MNSFDKLLTNISWLYEKGYPDFSIKEDREALYDYLLSIGFPHSDVIELSERFIGEQDDEWWTKMSPEQQAQYIKDHPKSQKAQDAKEGTAKEPTQYGKLYKHFGADNKNKDMRMQLHEEVNMYTDN